MINKLLHYERSIQDLSLYYIKNKESYQNSKEKKETSSIKSGSDIIELTDNASELSNLGLDLTYSKQIKENTTLNFQYNFSNTILDIKNTGSYNLLLKSGSLDIQIDISKIIDTLNNTTGNLPTQIKISFNFSLSEKQINYEKGTETKEPDMLSLILRLIRKIIEIIRDGQDKEIKLSFDDWKTFLNFLGLDKGKIAQQILAWLFIISRLHNQNDEDGKRDRVVIVIPDKEIEYEYEEKKTTIKLSNIQFELNFKIDPTSNEQVTSDSNSKEEITTSQL
jgi:hypothetical protein